MRYRDAGLWFSLILGCISPALAQTAHSLDRVPALLTSPEARQSFSDEINGSTADRLGRTLPAGIDAHAVAALLVPSSDTSAVNTVGIKPIADQPDHYLAFVCTGGFIPTSAKDIPCFTDAHDGPALQGYVGLIEAKAATPPRLLAAPAAVSMAVDWRNSGLPTTPEALEDTPSGLLVPTSVDALDLAPYRIAPNQPAYGVRVGWSDGYAGGFGSYQALQLFAVIDGALRPILATPISGLLNTAGDWHKDGSRDHEVTQGAHILVVSQAMTDGHYDMIVKDRSRRWQRLFRWSGAASQYRPAR